MKTEKTLRKLLREKYIYLFVVFVLFSFPFAESQVVIDDGGGSAGGGGSFCNSKLCPDGNTVSCSPCTDSWCTEDCVCGTCPDPCASVSCSTRSYCGGDHVWHQDMKCSGGSCYDDGAAYRGPTCEGGYSCRGSREVVYYSSSCVSGGCDTEGPFHETWCGATSQWQCVGSNNQWQRRTRADTCSGGSCINPAWGSWSNQTNCNTYACSSTNNCYGSCPGITNSNCATTASCFSGSCISDNSRNPGQTCTQKVQCSAGWCTQYGEYEDRTNLGGTAGYCLKDDGASCSAGNQCVSGLCVDGTCQTACGNDANAAKSCSGEGDDNSGYISSATSATYSTGAGGRICKVLSNNNWHCGAYDETQNQCSNEINNLHSGIDSFRNNFLTAGNTDLPSQWSPTADACCGTLSIHSGYVGIYSDVLHACTASNDGEFGWVHSEIPGRVYNITSKPEFWSLGHDKEGNTDFPSFNYLVGTSDTGLVACDIRYDGLDFAGAPVLDRGFFNNMDCSRSDVHCIGINSAKNLDGRGFLCIDSGSATGQEETSSPIMLTCGDNLWNDLQEERGNTRYLSSGEYASYNGEDAWICTEDGFILASELDDFGGEPQGLEYSLLDFSCENVVLSNMYGVHTNPLIDRFWRTARYCCGNSILDAQSLVVEFFSDDQTVGYGERACWNNRGVMDDSTISFLTDNNWNTRADSQSNLDTYNLLRLSDYLFEYDIDELKYWNYDLIGDQTSIELNLVLDENRVEFPEENNALYDIDSIELELSYPFHLVGGVEYVLLYGLDLSNPDPAVRENVKGSVTLEIKEPSGDYYVPEFSKIPRHITDEIGLNSLGQGYEYNILKPETNGEYSIKLTINRPESSDIIDFYGLKLVPRPVVLSNQGELFACLNKSLNNPLPLLASTNEPESLIFENDYVSEHCTNLGTHVCTPEGTWIRSEDLTATHRTSENSLRTEISRSPNIIEDSSFNGGGSFSIDGCYFSELSSVNTNANEPHMNERFDESDAPGVFFLSCDGVDNFNVYFRDSNNKSLYGDREYIFSAWVRALNAGGEISNADEQVEITNPSWERVELHGIADDGGNFVVTFSGDFEIDMVQLEEKHADQFERTKYFRTETRRACCPIDSCWNGHECVYMDASSGTNFGTNEEFFLAEPGFLTNDDERGYICIGGGNFTFSEKVYRWVDDDPLAFERFNGDLTKTQDMTEFGFCEPGSCFVGRNKEGSDGKDRHVIARQDCAPNGTEFYGRYCDNGNWRSKLEQVSSLMYKIAEQNKPYSLFCGHYMDVLNYYSFDFELSSNPDVRDIFSQNLLPYQNFKIRYLDQACVLRHGSDSNNVIIALSLNEDIDFENTETPELESALKYFGVSNPISTCSVSGEDTLGRCSNNVNLFYNKDSKTLVFVGSSAVMNQITNPDIDYSISDYQNLEQSTWIDSLKNSFLNNMTRYDDKHHLGTDSFIRRVNTSLTNYDNYDELFIFKSGDKHMYVAREKHLNLLRRNNAFEYFYMINTSGFNVDLDFYTVGGINTVISPLYPPEKNITFIDIFNQTSNTIVDMYDDSIYALYMGEEKNNDFFRDWYMFTGRLRGDLRLPR